jgi:hypothetical protein
MVVELYSYTSLPPNNHMKGLGKFHQQFIRDFETDIKKVTFVSSPSLLQNTLDSQLIRRTGWF